MISQDEKIRSEVIEEALRLEEPSVSCRVEDGNVILEGTVLSDEHAYQLEDRVRAIPGVRSVQNLLMVQGFGAVIRNEIEGIDLTPDFTAEAGTDDSLEATSEAQPYIPPTDPVITTSGRTADNVEILNGFAESADQNDVRESGTAPRGDEDLQAAVMEALRLNASTSDLDIQVIAREGVVTLRGPVPSLDDAESAEGVAASVPGVDEVVEELRVEGM